MNAQPMRRIDAPRRQHSGPLARPSTRRSHGTLRPGYRRVKHQVPMARRDGHRDAADADALVERTTLRVVPRRRLAANAAALTVVLLGVLMLSAVVLHTRLSERQLEIDRLEQEATSSRAVFDVLRQQRAELRAPTKLASESVRLGMYPAPAAEFLDIDPYALARVLATTGTIDADDSTLIENDPLDQVRRVRAAEDDGQ